MKEGKIMIKEYFAIAFRSVLAHKIRALLTTLGVIIGVASVILLMSLGNSAREEAANQIRGIGSNLIFVNITDRQGNLPNDWLDEIKDAALIKGYSQLISSSAVYVVEGQDVNVSINGVNDKYASVNSIETSQGRFLSEYDLEYDTPVEEKK